MRHTNASVRNEMGQDIKTISTSLGHASILTTGNLYMSVTEDKIRKSVEVFDDLIYKSMATNLGTSEPTVQLLKE